MNESHLYADKMEEELMERPLEVAKTREEYDRMTKDELVEYSRKFGEKVMSCHKSDKNHRYPCSWCKKVPDETRVYVSKDRRDARYLCYRCANEEDQLAEWTELQETSYWLPIRPPSLPKFNAGDEGLTVEAAETPLEIKKQLFQTPLPPGRFDSRYQQFFYDKIKKEEEEELQPTMKKTKLE